MSGRALVLSGAGINCEEESAAAFRQAGMEVRIGYVGEVLDGRLPLRGFQVLCLPGGFSFGDDLGSGMVLARAMRHGLGAEATPNPGAATSPPPNPGSPASWPAPPFLVRLQDFLARGGFVLGICNGFQVLVKLGLLPNLSGRFEQEVTLARNDSGRFEDRWVECAAAPGNPSPFLAGIERLRLPVRHGEGRLLARDAEVRERIRALRLDALRYCDADGQPTDRYPQNPNGAELACAGLSDPSGQVFGLMPHPEAFLTAYTDPCWPQRKRAGELPSDEAGAGLRLFQNIARAVAREGARFAFASRAGIQAADTLGGRR